MHFRGCRHHFRGCQEHEQDHNVSHNVSREGVLDTYLRLSIYPDLGPDMGNANHYGTRNRVTSKYRICTPAGTHEKHMAGARGTQRVPSPILLAITLRGTKFDTSLNILQ